MISDNSVCEIYATCADMLSLFNTRFDSSAYRHFEGPLPSYLSAHGSMNVEGSIWIERGPLPSCLSAHGSLDVEGSI